MNIRPLADRALVEPIDEDAMSPGGIFIPESARKEKARKGRVLAVGAGRFLPNGRRKAVDVQVGDIIIFPKYIGAKVKIEDRDLLIVRTNDMIAVAQQEPQ